MSSAKPTPDLDDAIVSYLEWQYLKNVYVTPPVPKRSDVTRKKQLKQLRRLDESPSKLQVPDIDKVFSTIDVIDTRTTGAPPELQGMLIRLDQNPFVSLYRYVHGELNCFCVRYTLLHNYMRHHMVNPDNPSQTIETNHNGHHMNLISDNALLTRTFKKMLERVCPKEHVLRSNLCTFKIATHALCLLFFPVQDFVRALIYQDVLINGRPKLRESTVHTFLCLEIMRDLIGTGSIEELWLDYCQQNMHENHFLANDFDGHRKLMDEQLAKEMEERRKYRQEYGKRKGGSDDVCVYQTIPPQTLEFLTTIQRYRKPKAVLQILKTLNMSGHLVYASD